MRLIVLGAPRPIDRNRWKDDLCESAAGLGWQVMHLPARGIHAVDVVQLARGADALLWARTHGENPAGDTAGMLRRIEDAGTTTIGLHFDLYWDVPHRQANIGVDPWWSCQYTFTADGGPRDWAGRGVNHHWCPPPASARFFGRGMPDEKYMCQAVFAGRDVPRIHGPHRADLIVWAMRRWTTGFRRVGGAYGQVWGAELSNLYASAQYAIGDSAPADFYWSDRIPNTLSRGAVLAHPQVPGMAEQGFTDETMVTFPRGDFDTLGAKLDALTETDRLRIGDNALTVIGERHMWTHRLREIERVVFGARDRGVRGQPVEMGRPPAGNPIASGAAA